MVENQIVGENDQRRTLTQIRLAAGAAGFNWLPVVVSQQLGLFEGRGLDVTIARLGSVDKATAAVKAGEADIVITPPEGAIRDATEGGHLRIIAANVNRLPLSLIANPKITRFEQLKGKVLGTSSLTEGTAIYTKEMLAQHGLHYPADYGFAVVGVHPARWRALQDGTIDAAVQLIPLDFVAIDAGYTNLGSVMDAIPEIVFTAVIADGRWAEANRSSVVALLQCLIEATAWIYDPANQEAVLPVVMELAQADEIQARRSLKFMRDNDVLSRDLKIPKVAFDTSVNLIKRYVLAEGETLTAPERVLDDSFRRQAG